MCARPPDLTARRSSEDRPRRAPRRRRWRAEFYFLALLVLLAVVRVLSELGAPSDAPSPSLLATQAFYAAHVAPSPLSRIMQKLACDIAKFSSFHSSVTKASTNCGLYRRNSLTAFISATLWRQRPPGGDEDEHVPVLEQASPPRSSQ